MLCIISCSGLYCCSYAEMEDSEEMKKSASKLCVYVKFADHAYYYCCWCNYARGCVK